MKIRIQVKLAALATVQHLVRERRVRGTARYPRTAAGRLAALRFHRSTGATSDYHDARYKKRNQVVPLIVEALEKLEAWRQRRSIYSRLSRRWRPTPWLTCDEGDVGGGRGDGEAASRSEAVGDDKDRL